MTPAHARQILKEARDIGFAEFVEGAHRTVVWDDEGTIRWRVEGKNSRTVFAEGWAGNFNISIAAAAAATAEFTEHRCEDLRED